MTGSIEWGQLSAVSLAVERPLHTRKVTGSNPVPRISGLFLSNPEFISRRAALIMVIYSSKVCRRCRKLQFLGKSRIMKIKQRQLIGTIPVIGITLALTMYLSQLVIPYLTVNNPD